MTGPFQGPKYEMSYVVNYNKLSAKKCEYIGKNILSSQYMIGNVEHSFRNSFLNRIGMNSVGGRIVPALKLS
jgi:predicted thioesterase